MDRVNIGNNFYRQPVWKRYLAVPLIYLPIITTIPFVMLGVIIVRLHLRHVGGMHIKPFSAFVPDWISHRYTFKNQISFSTDSRPTQFRYYRLYWIFNCKLYCPLSVALFRYAAYLVMIVENWWCPFDHDKKADYAPGAVDYSYWHIHQQEKAMLHPDDRDNVIWNQDAETKKTTGKKDGVTTTD